MGGVGGVAEMSWVRAVGNAFHPVEHHITETRAYFPH